MSAKHFRVLFIFICYFVCFTYLFTSLSLICVIVFVVCLSQAVVPGDVPSNCLLSTHTEKDHVYRVYDNIAIHWNHTRGKRKVYWHRVKDFLDNLKPGSMLAGEVK